MELINNDWFFLYLYALSQPIALNLGRYNSINEVVIEGAKETETQAVK
jgi:hypothetical protein